MTETEARAILEQGIAACHADDAVLTLRGEDEGSTRFANNSITQSVSRTDVNLTIRAAYGNKVGMAQTNRLNPEGVAEAVSRAEEIARQSEPDTEYMPPVEPCAIPSVEAWDPSVASASPADRAHVVRDVIETIRTHDLTAAGSYATTSGFTAVLNSRGHFAYHRQTGAQLVCTALSPDSSGWASAGSHRRQDIDGHAAGERAAQKAIVGRNPQPIEAKPYTVILEPAALSEILSFLAWSLDAKAADEGRSAFAGKAGQQIGVPAINLSSIPDHPECPVPPFGADGMPSPTVQWIESGVLKNLAHTRYWAQKMNRPYTGFPTNLIMSGSEASLEDMVASTEYGLLVTRFWYIRYVDPMKLLLTGMTRDGLFLIRDGRIASGVKNMRFNESPLRMLPRVRQLGVPQVVTVHGPAYLPPMKVDEFTFSSATAF